MRYFIVFFAIAFTFGDEVGQKIGENVGVSQSFGEGNICNVQIEGNNFKVYILNEERIVQEPPYSKGFVRYRYISGPNRNKQFTSPLYPEKSYYSSPRNIKPPHYFFLYVRFRDQDNQFIEIPRIRYPYE